MRSRSGANRSGTFRLYNSRSGRREIGPRPIRPPHPNGLDKVDTDLPIGQNTQNGPILLRSLRRDFRIAADGKTRSGATTATPEKLGLPESNLRDFLLQSHYVGVRRGVLGRYLYSFRRERMDLGRVLAWSLASVMETLVNGCMGSGLMGAGFWARGACPQNLGHLERLLQKAAQKSVV